MLRHFISSNHIIKLTAKGPHSVSIRPSCNGAALMLSTLSICLLCHATLIGDQQMSSYHRHCCPGAVAFHTWKVEFHPFPFIMTLHASLCQDACLALSLLSRSSDVTLFETCAPFSIPHARLPGSRNVCVDGN